MTSTTVERRTPDGPTAEGLAQVINLQKDLDESQACIFGVANTHIGHARLGPRWFFDAGRVGSAPRPKLVHACARLCADFERPVISPRRG